MDDRVVASSYSPHFKLSHTTGAACVVTRSALTNHDSDGERGRRDVGGAWRAWTATRASARVGAHQRAQEGAQLDTAMNALKSTSGLADAEDEDVRARMGEKHPAGPTIDTPNDLPSAAEHKISLKDAKKLLQSADRGKAAGPSRLTNEMIRSRQKVQEPSTPSWPTSTPSPADPSAK